MIVGDYLRSVEDHYGPEIDRPWAEVVAEVESAVASSISRDGEFLVWGAVGAFICR